MTKVDHATARLGAALVVLGGSTAIVAGHRGPFPGEVGLLQAVNDLPRAVGIPLEAMMQLGSLLVALVVVAIIPLATRSRGPAPTLAALLAVIVAYRLDDVVKAMVERPRPASVIDDLTTRDVAGGFAFPSGHTTVAFALAASISPLLPSRWHWVPYVFAACTAVARLYVGVHWPTDLLGGAALGIAVACAAALLVASAASVATARRDPTSR